MTATPSHHVTTKAQGSVLAIRNLRICFDTPSSTIHAVDDVSLDVSTSDIIAIIGESGSGKSVLALSILGLIPMPPGKILSGSIELCQKKILSMPEHELVKVRGSLASMIFQNPRGSLDPSFSVETAFSEVLSRHRPDLSKKDRALFIEEALRQVGFTDWHRVARSYPHQLSGGMCQRVALALSLACNPSLLIADEPTTALDVGVQARILHLLRQINERTKLPILLITHDFGVVKAIAHKVVVMYAGHVQEEGTVDHVLHSPLHPYTQALIASVPGHAKPHERLFQIRGSPPRLDDPPTGCRFTDRCEFAMPACYSKLPPLTRLSHSRSVRCHLHQSTGEEP